MDEKTTKEVVLTLVVRTEDGEEVVGTLTGTEPEPAPPPPRQNPNYKGYVPKSARELLAEMESARRERVSAKRDRRLARRFLRRIELERAFYEALHKSASERAGKWEAMRARIALAQELAKHRRFVALAVRRIVIGPARTARLRYIARSSLRREQDYYERTCVAYSMRGSAPPWWHRAWPPPGRIRCEECHNMIGDD